MDEIEEDTSFVGLLWYKIPIPDKFHILFSF